ncbi:MAG: hypothetical protein IE935_02610 [Micrococcales bacterium]|nr:hypothetical protein [Micrococcales bacterium]
MRNAPTSKQSSVRRPAPPPSGPRWWHYLLVGLLATIAIVLAGAALTQDHSPPQPRERVVSLGLPATGPMPDAVTPS